MSYLTISHKINCLALCDDSLMQQILTAQGSNLINMVIIDENFHFFRTLEREIWQIIILHNHIWDFLPKDSSLRLSNYLDQKKTALFPKTIFIDQNNYNAQQLKESILPRILNKHLKHFKFIKHNNEKPNGIPNDVPNGIATSIKETKNSSQERPVDYYIQSQQAFHQLPQTLQYIIYEARHHSSQKIRQNNPLEKPFPFFAGESTVSYRLQEVFGEQRNNPKPLFLSGPKGSLLTDYVSWIQQWRDPENFQNMHLDISDSLTDLPNLLDLQLLGIRTITLISDCHQKTISHDLKIFIKNAYKINIKIIIICTNRINPWLKQSKDFFGDTFALPSLTSRISDIPAIIAQIFADSLGDETMPKIDLDCLKSLLQYPWPNNYAELKNLTYYWLRNEKKLIKRNDLPLHILVRDEAFYDLVRSVHLPATGIDLQEIERILLSKAMQQTQGSISKAARLLKIGRKALYYRLGKYNML